MSRTVPSLVVLCAIAGIAVSACGVTESTKEKEGTNAVTIAFTDDGCVPKPASVKAGAWVFKVTNDGASRVSETELMQNGRIVGEKENLTDGLSGKFTLNLEPGEYVVNCPNAKNDQAKFTVTPGDGKQQKADPTLEEGVQAYQAYIQSKARSLTPKVDAFVAAVQSGDLEKAKQLYAPARSDYETIEPVAETFGNLDPEIDARVNDVPDVAKWTGFHRIEKALWQDKSLKGMAPIATKLKADVHQLATLVKTVKLRPEQIANGAVGLLDEVARSKITGEEDRYSHTDLWDFDANVAGAREAFQVLEPALKKKDKALTETIDARFSDVLQALSKYQTAGGYIDYSTVGAADRRKLTTVVNALAEPLSQVAGKVV
ncbi:MAG TPA: iron uptake system protein EfeO [Mycobacteriales bacterium]|nr:iron uptake system protein EfeO [Mycobacteriales bacterium]